MIHREDVSQAGAAGRNQIQRRADMPVPNVLNTVLVVAVSLGLVGLLWLGSRLESWYLWLVIGVVFSYLGLTNYALLHEATHDNLHDQPRWNYWLGVVTGIFFLAPFSMIRVTHQGHHHRNRTDDEMFDLYYPTDSFLMKCVQWYGTLVGLFWPCIPTCAVLFALSPRTIGMQLFSGPPLGNANVKDITPSDLWRIRGELILTAGVFATLFWMLDLRWPVVLIAYACFSVNWSTRQYVGHAFSQRAIIEGAWNHRHNWLMTKVLLNGNLDLNHHRHPELSWYYLPRLAGTGTDLPSYVKHYWLQWTGPRLAVEPPPELLGKNETKAATAAGIKQSEELHAATSPSTIRGPSS